MAPLTLTLAASLALPPTVTLTLPRLGTLPPAPVVAPAHSPTPTVEESTGPLRNLGVMSVGLVGVQVGTLYLLSYFACQRDRLGRGLVPRHPGQRSARALKEAWHQIRSSSTAQVV